MAIRGRFETIGMYVGMWAIVVLLAFAVAFMAFAVWDVYEKERGARSDRREAETHRASLEERHVMLEARVEHLDTDRGVEEVLRDRFLAAREGEEVIILVDAPPPALDTSEAPRKSIWETIKGWFGF